jgi:hypothetical protein
MTAEKEKLLLVVSAFYVDRGAEAQVVNKYFNTRKITWELDMVQVNWTR